MLVLHACMYILIQRMMEQVTQHVFLITNFILNCIPSQMNIVEAGVEDHTEDKESIFSG